MINRVVLEKITKKSSESNLFIYGAGSFGRKIFNVLRFNSLNITGFIDGNKNLENQFVLNKPVIALDKVIKNDNYFIVVCSTYYDEIELMLLESGVNKNNFLIIYPDSWNLSKSSHRLKGSFIDYQDSVIFMEDSTLRLDNFDDISNKVAIGENSIINCNFIFEDKMGEIIVGENTYIGAGTNLISKSKIVIGNNVTISWGCYIYDHNSHSLNHMNRRKDFESFREGYIKYGNPVALKDWQTVDTKEIKIEDDVWIGFDVTILKGVTIGEGAIVAAKSVVTKDVPPWSVVAGSPAKVVKWLDK